MAPSNAIADVPRVRNRLALATAVISLAAAAVAGISSSATSGSGRAGCAGELGNGYTYAGHQASYQGHGVRATITPTRMPAVAAGHVAGWVGVGGPGQGRNGEDAWIQAGIARVAGAEPFIYAEVTRNGGTPELTIVEHGVAPGRPHSLAVLEMGGRKGWWRVWLDGHPVTEPVRLPGSSGRWAPIATAEAFNGGAASCNRFAFRFERVSVSYGGGGSWRHLVPEHDFLDPGYRLERLAEAPARQGTYSRTLAVQDGRPLPYAFVASGSR
jgi:hypothetical protein